jgi:cytochrome c oxidase cbb3-type subunit 4
MGAIYEWLRSLWVVWLMAVFIGIVAWVYWPKRKREMEEHGRIPLRDDDGDDGED